jgi:hypothetical protein
MSRYSITHPDEFYEPSARWDERIVREAYAPCMLCGEPGCPADCWPQEAAGGGLPALPLPEGATALDEAFCAAVSAEEIERERAETLRQARARGDAE